MQVDEVPEPDDEAETCEPGEYAVTASHTKKYQLDQNRDQAQLTHVLRCQGSVLVLVSLTRYDSLYWSWFACTDVAMPVLIVVNEHYVPVDSIHIVARDE